MIRSVLVLVGGATLVLGGVAASERGGATSSQVRPALARLAADSPPDPHAGATPQCSVLDEAEIAGLAGEPLTPTHSEGRPSMVPACTWGSLPEGAVVVATGPAATWALALPETVAAVDPARIVGDPAAARRLDEAGDLIASGSPVSDARACELFADLVGLIGDEPGPGTDATVITSETGSRAVTGQACAGGTYVSVLLAGPAVEGGEDEVARVEAAVAAAQRSLAP